MTPTLNRVIIHAVMDIQPLIFQALYGLEDRDRLAPPPYRVGMKGRTLLGGRSGCTAGLWTLERAGHVAVQFSTNEVVSGDRCPVWRSDDDSAKTSPVVDELVLAHEFTVNAIESLVEEACRAPVVIEYEQRTSGWSAVLRGSPLGESFRSTRPTIRSTKIEARGHLLHDFLIAFVEQLDAVGAAR